MPVAFRFALLALALAAAAPAMEAKKFNISNGVPSSSQAIINRVYANMAASGDQGGQYGQYESDCSDLDIGANDADGRPDSQVIVADTIINAGGKCRAVRRNGLFSQKEPVPEAKSGTKSAPKTKP